MITIKTGCQSPCETCTRVKDPANCENKHCSTWRAWFSARWELIRGYPRRSKNQLQPGSEPTEDPCSHCASPRELCKTPCRSRVAWDRTQEGQAV